jgi:hypothetical protein
MIKIDSSNFKRLLGDWKTSGNIKSGQENRKLTGIDTYEAILDGNFILHKADVQMGDERSETFEIIRSDNASHKATLQYFNTKGEVGTMMGSIVENEFRIEGNGLMFKGTINDENTRIVGKWYVQKENKWTDFIDLTLEKK